MHLTVIDRRYRKNYNESILESMSSGVVTVNEDGIIQTCNQAGFANHAGGGGGNSAQTG